MIKYLILIILLISIIPIVNAEDVTVCPACPQQTPHIVYVTVTVPVPSGPDITQSICLPSAQIPPTKIFGIPQEYIIYAGLILIFIIIIIILLKKLKGKTKPTIKNEQIPNSNKYDDLYEDEPPKIIKETPVERRKETDENKIKKPKQKKPKSLLDQDFEF